MPLEWTGKERREQPIVFDHAGLRSDLAFFIHLPQLIGIHIQG
jgi:hypothetical protein